MRLRPSLALPETVKKVLPYLLLTCVIVSTGWAAYHFGYTRGTTEVRLAWEQAKAETRAEHDALVLELSQQVETHRVEQERIAHELAKAREDADLAIAGVRLTYEQRVLQSTRRATLYQRQAQAGAVAQRNLASHAARLDRALEEGIGLVGELQATLGLREHQLTLLGQQILRDREACEGATP